MGPIRIPPLPAQMILTDRADGTLWLLSHNTIENSPDGLGHISINSVYNLRNDIDTFLPFEGPVLLAGDPPDTTIRLLIRDGLLGYETTPYIQQRGDIRQARILTRKGVAAESREINVPNSWRIPGDVLGWTPVIF